MATVWVDEGQYSNLCGQKDFNWGRYFNVDREECPIKLTKPTTRAWNDGDTDMIVNQGTIPVTFTYAMDWVTLEGRTEFKRETITLGPQESLVLTYPPRAEWLAAGPAAIHIWPIDPNKATYTYEIHITVWVDEDPYQRSWI